MSAVRHVSEFRAGILTVLEKWELIFAGAEINIHTKPHSDTIAIPANLIPTKENAEAILEFYKTRDVSETDSSFAYVHYPLDIYRLNDSFIREDFTLITQNRKSILPESHNHYIHPEHIFIEEGAKVQGAFLNASTGPIYIGKDAQVMEGSCIRGPFALGENGVVKMGAKIYGATSSGPHCVLGGEIKNSIFFGYSNKAHDGYLGDSVLGYWCNLGAGTSNSNVKNTAGAVKYKLDAKGTYIEAGYKAGLIMGDYSRSAINTSFNTGTIVGVCCNIFDSGFPPVFIPDFTWGNEKYNIDKAIQDIDNWKKLKGYKISQEETNKLSELHQSQI